VKEDLEQRQCNFFRLKDWVQDRQSYSPIIRNQIIKDRWEVRKKKKNASLSTEFLTSLSGSTRPMDGRIALQHHWFLPINYQFDVCKAQLVQSLCKQRYIRISD